MNRHGTRFLTSWEFRSHAEALNVRFLDDRELEFYEQHCLLLPVFTTHEPPAHAVAVTEHNLGVHVSNPDDLDPPGAWQRLQRSDVDGLHVFDFERGKNPLLVTPDCSIFEPWATHPVSVTMPDGNVVRQPTVERYYAPWQVHVVELLRRNRYYYIHPQFWRRLDPGNYIPTNTERIQSLRGMAIGFDALELFRFADQVALRDAFDGVSIGEEFSEAAQSTIHTVRARWARRALDMAGLEEPALFQFLGQLARLITEYRGGERISLAVDLEEYLRDAEELAGLAFGHDWDSFLAAADRHSGPGLAAQLRQLDPLEAAASDARWNLNTVLGREPIAGFISSRDNLGNVAEEIVDFCLDHDLLEVVFSLQHYSFTTSDQRRDRFPGFHNRRLRPLALAGEQLLRGIIDAQPEPDDNASNNGLEGHRGRTYSKVVEILGKHSSWLTYFQTLKRRGQTSDKQGDLDYRALNLVTAAHQSGARGDEAVACTLAAAVATRNLVKPSTSISSL